MRLPGINDPVRLKHDMPELELHRGETGIVRSTWCAPAAVFEVEFEPSGQPSRRALLQAEQIILTELGNEEE
jgi:hypothetical protein